MSTTLQDLVNRAVFYSTEVQSHFGRLIGDASWEVDFSSEPSLRFTASDGTVLLTRPHLIGSESKSQGTWLWGWENINEFPEPVVSLAHDVRRYGAGQEVPELVEAELSLDEDLALRLMLAAKEATGKWAHYPAAAGAGTQVWLLVDAAGLELPDPEVKSVVRVLMQGLSQTTVSDHRAAVDSYVQKRGIITAPLPDDGLRLLFTDGSADLTFDEQNRITNCQMHAPLEGEAAAQFAAGGGVAVPAASTNAPVEAAPAAPSSSRTSESSSAEQAPAAAPETPAASPADQTVAEVPAAESSSSVPAAAQSPAAQSPADEGSAPTASTSPADETAESAAADDAAGTPAAEAPAEPQPTTPAPEPAAAKKKKGLFSKLFGR